MVSGRRLAVLLLAAGLAVRLAYSWHGHRTAAIPTAVDQYEDIARNLLDGKGYSIVPGVPTAVALSTGAAYLGALLEAGFEPGAAARQLAVQIAVGRDTFG